MYSNYPQHDGLAITKCSLVAWAAIVVVLGVVGFNILSALHARFTMLLP